MTPRTRRRRCSAPWVGQPAALRARPISGVRQSARVSLAPPPRPTRRYGWTSTTRADLKRIVLRIDPDPGVRLQLSALASQSPRVVHLDTSFARELGEPTEPYERLLHAALKRRPPAVRRVGQCRGNLARRPAAAGRPFSRPPVLARIVGAGRGGRTGPRLSALAAAVAGRGSLTPGTKPPEGCLSRHRAALGPAAPAVLRRCGG